MEKKKTSKTDNIKKRYNDQVKGLIEIRDSKGNLVVSNYKSSKNKTNAKK